MSVVLPILRQPVTHDWETPRELFDSLNTEFSFVLDAAASDDNALCKRYYTRVTNALWFNWEAEGGAVFCNPPYGQEIARWVQKCFEQSQRGMTVVMLIPSRTDTRYWHSFVMRAAEIRFIRQRLRFGGESDCGNTAPFPSAVVVFRPGEYVPVVSSIDKRGRAVAL
jgi:phage N-6-adenine-methyltransferase